MPTPRLWRQAQGAVPPLPRIGQALARQLRLMEAEGKQEGQVALSQREAGDVGLGVAGPWAAREGWGWGRWDSACHKNHCSQGPQLSAWCRAVLPG